MCLVVHKDSMIRCAETEVECWKVLVMKDDGKLYSPFMKCEYALGEEKRIKVDECLKVSHDYRGDFSVWYHTVTHGFHTYADYADAACEASYTSFDSQKRVIVRCAIPVGAKYVEGYVSSIWGERGYVSDRLKIIEIDP